MFAEKDYTPSVASASILPSFDLEISNTVHWYEPSGNTRTGCLQSLEFIDGNWWGSARYELTPGFWATDHQHAHNYFNGPGAEFVLQIGQPVFFKSGSKWQAATVADVYLESDSEWFAALEYPLWYGIVSDEKPLCEVHTTQPELDENPDYSAWCDDRNDSAYEDMRDSKV